MVDKRVLDNFIFCLVGVDSGMVIIICASADGIIVCWVDSGRWLISRIILGLVSWIIFFAGSEVRVEGDFLIESPLVWPVSAESSSTGSVLIGSGSNLERVDQEADSLVPSRGLSNLLVLSISSKYFSW